MVEMESVRGRGWGDGMSEERAWAAWSSVAMLAILGAVVWERRERKVVKRLVMRDAGESLGLVLF
jgi:hypothetical protein